MKRILREEGLSRRRNVSDFDLRDAIRNELSTCLSLVGYRQMTESLSVKYGINISKEDVRKALKEVDPIGVDRRRSRVIKRRIYASDGPGHIYHIDGNDKLNFVYTVVSTDLAAK